MKKNFKKIAAIVAAAAVASAITVSASAESYNAYVQFQNTVYSFRNAFNEANYGATTPYFDSVIVWGGNDSETWPELEDNFDYDIEGYVIPANFTNAVIDGDGTYTVSIDDFDWALDAASSFNLLLVSTDIPLDSGAVISDAKIIVDGNVEATIAEPMLNPDEKEYIAPMFANIWNSDLESYAGAYPTTSLAIEFTVSGLGTAAGEVEEVAEAPVDTADAAADTTAETTTDDKASPDTGVEGVAAVAGLAVVATGAVIVSKKRK